jgi:PKD repeat protein
MRRRTLVQLVVLGMLLALVSGGTSAQGAGEPGVVHFTAAGDFGSNANTDAVLAGMKAAGGDLSLALGDLSYATTGQEQLWCDRVTGRLGAGYPFELLSGNHESNGQNGNINDFSACLPNQLPGVVGTYGRQWYIDVPQVNPVVRFVMVSPALPFSDGTWSYAAGTPRYNWTVAAIDGARANNIPWVVVGEHKPCYSIGVYTCEVGADFTNMLISKRVDLVLTGHEHMYQRTHQLGLRTGCTTVPPDAFDADCLADTDATMNQGAGTVFATSGLGGQERRDVDNADPDAGYFATASGGNQNPTDGFLDVKVTATDLTADFVPVGTGTFTDHFTIHHGTPPPDSPPTAAFASTTSNLTATFDGRGSSDPEGPIASYSWDYGDGSTPPGTGAQPSHTYAAAGTYTVTLTVTDSGGATNALTQAVTVTEPPPGPVDFVTDTFNRTVSNGWGTADVGGAWSVAGTAADFAVNNGSGAITLPATGRTRSVWLPSTTRSDTDLRLTLSLDKVPTGSGAYLDVVGRRVSTNNEYRTRMIMASTGRITVQLTALKGTGTPVAVAPAVTLPTTVTYSAGSQLDVRMQVTGTNPTTMRLKVWPAGATEPAAWQTTGTDTFAALQGPGAVGLTNYLSGSVTNAPVVVRMTALSARPTA